MDKCPLCGTQMKVTTEPVVDHENNEVVYGAEHFLCDECGYVSFTPGQLDDYQKTPSRPIEAS